MSKALIYIVDAEIVSIEIHGPLGTNPIVTLKYREITTDEAGTVQGKGPLKQTDMTDTTSIIPACQLLSRAFLKANYQDS